ncbi:MAG: glycerol-3-phosphate 1-O-acyltransferase PlsY [Clostridia bacterium]|nr:glycerol-3-phosphate 1-O-acyltransferase PlsY [Clostridia bacterium]
MYDLIYSHNYLQDVMMKKYPDSIGTVILIGCLALAVAGYFIGSINFSIIISKVFFKDDIRTHGSGNAGSTNMLRTHGTASGLITFFLDGLKAVAAVVLGAYVYNLPGTYVAGLFCIIGHIFPVFFKFKGGKGVATVAFIIAFTNLTTFIICLSAFLITVIISKYVSLGSIIAVALYPPVLFIVLKMSNAQNMEYVGVIFAFIIALIVILKHRTNIIKLSEHRESKISFSKHGTDGNKE